MEITCNEVVSSRYRFKEVQQPVDSFKSRLKYVGESQEKMLSVVS